MKHFCVMFIIGDVFCWFHQQCDPCDPSPTLTLSVYLKLLKNVFFLCNNNKCKWSKINITLWFLCRSYVTIAAMAPNQLVDYIVGTLWYTLTSPLTCASEVNLSKFWPPDTVYPHGPINSLPCLLSYHYKQKLWVDVIMHRCPVSLPAGRHSKEAEQSRTWVGLHQCLKWKKIM